MYKTERLAYYQELIAHLIPHEHLKLFAAQLIAENGAMTADRTGDNGCSVGLIQYNACVHHKVKATRFLELHPEWNDWKYQLEQMSLYVAKRVEIYGKNYDCIILHHNHPAAASSMFPNCSSHNYVKRVKSKIALLK